MVTPQRCYLICGNARCGSTMLCRALSDTGIAGHPEEYFLTWPEPLPERSYPQQRYWEESPLAREHGITSRDDYVALVHRVGSTPNGIFGAKLMWNYTPHVMAQFQEMPSCSGLNRAETLTTLFPDLHFIHLVRRNRLRQAVSWLRAAEDGVWYVSDTEPAHPKGHPRYDYDVIAGMMELIIQGERAWLELSEEMDIRPLEVVYEDLMTPGGYEHAVRSILRHLGLDDQVAVHSPRTKRQSDDVNEEWVARFRRDQEFRSTATAST